MRPRREPGPLQAALPLREEQPALLQRGERQAQPRGARRGLQLREEQQGPLREAEPVLRALQLARVQQASSLRSP